MTFLPCVTPAGESISLTSRINGMTIDTHTHTTASACVLVQTSNQRSCSNLPCSPTRGLISSDASLKSGNKNKNMSTEDEVGH